jgi:hypothetical protein
MPPSPGATPSMLVPEHVCITKPCVYCTEVLGTHDAGGNSASHRNVLLWRSRQPATAAAVEHISARLFDLNAEQLEAIEALVEAYLE